MVMEIILYFSTKPENRYLKKKYIHLQNPEPLKRIYNKSSYICSILCYVWGAYIDQIGAIPEKKPGGRLQI